jgi:glucose-6-phosphate isomerase
LREKIRFDYRHALPFVGGQDLNGINKKIAEVHQQLHNRSGRGNQFLGWLDLPLSYDREEFYRIKNTAERIKSDSDAFVVIGIGGSYIGARAAIEMLTHAFYNQLPAHKRNGPEIYFVGQNISSTYMSDLMECLAGKKLSLNVISKSGTTTEPAIAFRILKDYLERSYGREEARKRIYVTTDRTSGALRKLADDEGYESFVIPHDVGGRYSVLTAVGLLPMAVSGLDIDQIMAGAESAVHLYREAQWEINPCYQYAGMRHLLYQAGYAIELLVHYEPHLHSFTEWWKQLFGESEGKEKKGLFPGSLSFTTDLHSMGQYIQDGPRHLFETVLMVDTPQRELIIPSSRGNLDGLDDLAGKPVHHVNQKAFEGSLLAHVDGGVPNMVIHLPELAEYSFGQLVYFFQKACAISAYLLEVNPFDQPGVEAYKRNMFALLGKPGFEEERKKLEERMERM